MYPAASHLPSGEYATDRGSGASVRIFRSARDVTSSSRTVWSKLAVRSSLPSAENAAPTMPPLWISRWGISGRAASGPGLGGGGGGGGLGGGTTLAIASSSSARSSGSFHRLTRALIVS